MSTAVQRLSQQFLTEPDTAAVVFSAVNRRYFTGFPATDGLLLVTRDDSCLLMDFRYSEAASYAVKTSKIVEFSSLNDKLIELLQEYGIKKVYLEAENLSVAQAGRFAQALGKVGVETDTSSKLDDAIQALRTVKTEEEIGKIIAAQKITDLAFRHILPFIKPGVTEKEVAMELDFFMKKNGAEDISFETIAVAGKNGSLCHGVPGDNPIQDGDFLTMDYGALVDGYHADMTRTVAVGKISDEQKKVYELVLSAQLAALEAAKPGVVCSDVDKVARDMLDAAYPGKFGHGLGHGVGVEIHEWPRFSRLDHSKLVPGMVITVEPGIYLAGKFGVRIEDMIAITPSGTQNLTNSPKNLIML